MKVRSLFLTVAAGLLVMGIGAHDARAGSISLPTTLDPGLTSTVLTTPGVVIATSNGNSYTVGALTFSNFSYSSTASGTTLAYPATSVAVLAFSQNGELGIQLNAGWATTAPGSTLDMSINYTVTAALGYKITDAYLAIAGVVTGTGTGSVGETLAGTTPTTTLTASLPGSATDLQTFAGVQSINVIKDINLSAGTNGTSSISIVQQGFSVSAVPEPTSMALLGIGMTGFLAFRRLFKRTSVA